MAQGTGRATEPKGQDRPALMRDFHEYLNRQDFCDSTRKAYSSDVQSYVRYCADHPTASLLSGGRLDMGTTLSSVGSVGTFGRWGSCWFHVHTLCHPREINTSVSEIRSIKSDPLPRLPRGRFSVALDHKPPVECWETPKHTRQCRPL